ncbi:hypothetical protein LEM8419_00205 [Neolewinella maritima]|uniref:Guanylate cyclase domain-containing protein n=1 Tax=Neolewinella maritima TaxID=1383882 RepID=A0ABM9AW37_9BACT|nr:adenylate/guanylate cyclase domain-containing protein [Neolewinella maritima]CAH0998897.1 hypothetical protein LEM8419_00205 [Neolewinella maritima]
MLSPKVRKQWGQLLPFGLLFCLSSIVTLAIDAAVLGPDAELPVSAIDPTPGIYLFGVAAMGIIGLLIGYVELYLLSGLFRHRTLVEMIVYKLVIYLILMHILIVLVYPVAAAMELGQSPLHPDVRDKLSIYLVSRTHLSTSLQLGTTIALAIFYAQIGQHLGHANLLNFLTGRYHRPREEARIFLFADMTSSTTIAEQLGHLRYFDLLKDYYDDLSPAITRYLGEVHEYVGDEVVISWTYREGIHADNCLRCFFAMRQELERRRPYYLANYGVAPTFKAGLHCGHVTTGEIGLSKKKIVFTGDVLNATARIMALCGHYNTDLLLSECVVRELSERVRHHTVFLEEQRLRGKAGTVMLYTTEDVAIAA